MSDKLVKSLYYQAKLKAVENILNDDDISFYKRITRWYSQKFSTPLVDVRKMAFSKVLQEYYESTLEDTDYNEVYEYAMRELLPEFMAEIEASDKEFAQSLVEEQQRTIDKKRAREMKVKDEETVEIEEEVLENKQEIREPTAHETGERRPQSLKKQPKEIGLTFEDSDEEQ